MCPARLKRMLPSGAQSARPEQELQPPSGLRAPATAASISSWPRPAVRPHHAVLACIRRLIGRLVRAFWYSASRAASTGSTSGLCPRDRSTKRSWRGAAGATVGPPPPPSCCLACGCAGGPAPSWRSAAPTPASSASAITMSSSASPIGLQNFCRGRRGGQADCPDGSRASGGHWRSDLVCALTTANPAGLLGLCAPRLTWAALGGGGRISRPGFYRPGTS